MFIRILRHLRCTRMFVTKGVGFTFNTSGVRFMYITLGVGFMYIILGVGFTCMYITKVVEFMYGISLKKGFTYTCISPKK